MINSIIKLEELKLENIASILSNATKEFKTNTLREIVSNMSLIKDFENCLSDLNNDK